MQYMFSFLVLGNIPTAVSYMEQSGLRPFIENEIASWEYQFRWQDNPVLTTIEAPLAKSANYDEMIFRTDSILYFLNPDSPNERDLFQNIIKIITTVRQGLPVIVVLRKEGGFINENLNELFRWVWQNYFFEVFVSDGFQSNYLQNILSIVSEGLINNNPIINHSFVWLEFPFLIEQGQQALMRQNWSAVIPIYHKIALIAQLLGHKDWPIYMEQAAGYAAQNQDVLKAAHIIQRLNPKLAKKYLKEHVDLLFDKANIQMDQKQYTVAAQIYESAGNWAKLEINDDEMMKIAYRQSIIAWIQAAEIQNAFPLIEKFSHIDMITIMEEMTEYIAQLIDQLLMVQRLDLAKAQLYLCFQRYQKVGLFDSGKILANKAAKVLKLILEQDLSKKDVASARLTFDELINIWETFNLVGENIDYYLTQLIQQYIDLNDFQKVDSLISRIQSAELQKNMTENRIKREELKKQESKIERLAEVTQWTQIFQHYKEQEDNHFRAIHLNKREQATTLTDQGKYLEGARLLYAHGLWLKQIKQETYANEILIYCMDIYLARKFVSRFLRSISEISEKPRKKYIQTQEELIRSDLLALKTLIPLDRFEPLFEGIITLYRNHLLYEESHRFAELFADYLIEKGSQIANQMDIRTISRAIEILAKIDQLARSYFERKTFNVDKILQPIVSYYIKSDNLKDARAFNEKITTKAISGANYTLIEQIQSEKSNVVIQAAKTKQEKQFYTDQLSQLANQAPVNRASMENLFRMRTGLKRRFFQEPLDQLIAQNFEAATDLYDKSSFDLARIKKFELASVSAGITILLYLSRKAGVGFQQYLQKLEQELGSSFSILNETYPMKVINFILRCFTNKFFDLVLPAVKLCEFLPLFPEELHIVEGLLENDEKDFEQLASLMSRPDPASTTAIPLHYHLLIEKLESNLHLSSKRRVLEQKYWGDCQTYLTRQQYEEAANTYLDLVNELINRNYEIFAMNSIVMGFLVSIKSKSIAEVNSEYEKYIFQFTKKHEQITKSGVFQLLELFLQYWGNSNASQMHRDIGKAFQTHLTLFDWEISFINNLLLSLTETITSEKIRSSQKDSAIPASSPNLAGTLFTQQASALLQQIEAARTDLIQLKEKREKMIRTYYADILEDLQKQNFNAAADKYFNLAKRMARRNDYDTSSFMVFLAILCFIKTKIPNQNIKANLESFYSNLGIVKKILDDSIGLKVAHFLLDTMESHTLSNIQISDTISRIFSILPILDGEQILILRGRA